MTKITVFFDIYLKLLAFKKKW